jgi:hypothetical protein
MISNQFEIKYTNVSYNSKCQHISITLISCVKEKYNLKLESGILWFGKLNNAIDFNFFYYYRHFLTVSLLFLHFCISHRQVNHQTTKS